MSFDFEGEAISVLICFLISIGLVFLFYRLENKKRARSMRSFFVLVFLRFVGFFSLLFLLFNPFLVSFQKYEQIPKLIVAVDNSESIAFAGWTKDSLLNELSKFEEVQNGLEVEMVAFDNKLISIDSLSLHGERTNYQNTLSELENRYEGRLVEEVVFLSDGIVNDGRKELVNSSLSPVFNTVGLGGVSLVKDLKVRGLFHNQKVVFGNEFPLNVEVQMDDLRRQQSEVKIYFQGEEVHSEIVKPTKTREVFKINCKLKADSIGVQELRVVCSRVEGERLLKNNVRSSYVEIIEEKQSVVIVYNSPHPDVSALASCYESDKNFQISTLSYVDFLSKLPMNDSLADPDLLVLFGLPDEKSIVLALKERLKSYNGAYWHCFNEQMDQKITDLLPFGVKKRYERYDEAQPQISPQFSLFEFSEEERQLFSNVPPLSVPFGEYVYSSSFKAVLNQKIKGVKTEFPLLMVSQGLQNKTAWLSGEGIWKWRMQEVKYSIDGTAPVFDGFVKKVGAYLMSGSGEKGVSMIYNKIYAKGEQVLLRIELFNEAGQLTTQPAVNLYLKLNDGPSTKQECLVSEGSYQKDFGVLPVGKYGLELSYEFNGKKITKKGGFVVEETSIEQQNLVADFDYLKRMAEQSGGGYFHVSELDQLIDEINEKEHQKQSYFESFEEYLKDKMWLLYLLMIVFVLEWLIRKWNGAI